MEEYPSIGAMKRLGDVYGQAVCCLPFERMLQAKITIKKIQQALHMILSQKPTRIRSEGLAHTEKNLGRLFTTTKSPASAPNRCDSISRAVSTWADRRVNTVLAIHEPSRFASVTLAVAMSYITNNQMGNIIWRADALNMHMDGTLIFGSPIMPSRLLISVPVNAAPRLTTKQSRAESVVISGR